MKYFLKAKAFTLSELMVVMGIIGVILLFTFTTAKPSDKITKMLYQKAFDTLELAAYNVSETSVVYNTRVNSLKNRQRFCSKLSGYINTVKNECNENNPSFLSSNGMIYYFDEIMYYEKHPFYLVWVDINGNKKPNTKIVKKNKIVDIVPFAVTAKGEVAPLGIPLWDKAYMQARVVYPEDEKNEKIVPMLFGEAQEIAFGGKYYAVDSYSFNIENINVKNIPQELRKNQRVKLVQSPECKAKKKDDENLYSRCTVEVMK